MPERHIPVAFPARKAKGVAFALLHFSAAKGAEKCHYILVTDPCRGLTPMFAPRLLSVSN